MASQNFKSNFKLYFESVHYFCITLRLYSWATRKRKDPRVRYCWFLAAYRFNFLDILPVVHVIVGSKHKRSTSNSLSNSSPKTDFLYPTSEKQKTNQILLVIKSQTNRTATKKNTPRGFSYIYFTLIFVFCFCFLPQERSRLLLISVWGFGYRISRGLSRSVCVFCCSQWHMHIYIHAFYIYI